MRERAGGLCGGRDAGCVVLIFSLTVFFAFQMFRESTFFPGAVDNTMQTFAWFSEMHQALRHYHELPLWDFHQYAGTSFVGELQPGVFYPFNLLFCFFVSEITERNLSVYIFFHILFAEVATFFFLRRAGIARLIAAMAGMVFVFWGVVYFRSFGQANIFFGLTWLPLSLASYGRAIECRQRPFAQNPYIFGTAFCLGMAFLAGHMQPVVHIAFAMMVYMAVYSFRGSGRALWISLLIGVAAALLSSGQIYASLEYAMSSYRFYLGGMAKGMTVIPASAYLATAVPTLWPLYAVFLGYGERSTVVYAVSAVFYLLMLYGVVVRRHHLGKLTVFGMILMVVSFLASFGPANPVGYLFMVTPVLKLAYEPMRILFLFDFGRCILFAVGANELYRRFDWVCMRRALICVLGVMVVAFVSGVITRYAGLVGGRANSGVAAHYQCTSLLQWLEEQARGSHHLYRYECDSVEDTLSPNLASRHEDLFYLFGHRACMNIAYYDYLSRSWAFGSDEHNRLASRWYVVKKGHQGLRFAPGGQYDLAYEDEKYLVYENPQAYPVLTVKDGDQVTAATVTSAVYGANRVRFHVSVPADAVLTYAQPMYPDWRVYIDGKPSEVIQDDIFIAARITEGEHDVVFLYDPWWLKVYGATVLIFFLGAGYVIRRSGRTAVS